MGAAVRIVRAAPIGSAFGRVLLLPLLLPPILLHAASAATYTMVIAGLGGEPQYEQRFREHATALATAARGHGQVVVLAAQDATRDNVRREIKALAQRLTAADSITIVLIGHGSFDGEDYRYNLPGPDLTGSELGLLFDQLPAREQLIVNTTSASGATAERWRRSGRVIVTATKSGGERTATRFAQYWVQAVTTDAADVDKDETVTAAEAFEYASRQVAAAFKADVALATEHARMEGENAPAFAAARLGTATAPLDTEMTALLSQRRGIERELHAVKLRKQALAQEEYYDALEEVLVRLAVLQKQIDARQAVTP
jgi:hypothetical protein